MFTGLVEEVGTIRSISPSGGEARISIACRQVLDGLKRGDSVLVDGCCLTAEELDAEGFTTFASPETINRTSLSERKPGEGLNLERALALGDRLGGHLMSGHVDGTGTLSRKEKHGNAWEVRFAAPAEILRQSVQKGSIAVDGISLTIAELTGEDFSVWIIPETWERTTLSQRQPGQKVNLEVDLIGKYVFRYMESLGDETAQGREKEERLRDLLSHGGWSGR